MPQAWPASHLGALQDWKLVFWKLKKESPLGTSPASMNLSSATVLLGLVEAGSMPKTPGWSLELSRLRMGTTDQVKLLESWEACFLIWGGGRFQVVLSTSKMIPLEWKRGRVCGYFGEISLCRHT